MKVEAKVDGLTDASAALMSIDPAIRAIWKEEFARMAPEIAEGYRAKIRKRTGRTAATIGYNIREDGLQASIGSGSHVARFLELGTSDTPKFPALYPAFRTSVREYRKRVQNIEPRLRAKVKRGKALKK